LAKRGTLDPLESIQDSCSGKKKDLGNAPSKTRTCEDGEGTGGLEKITASNQRKEAIRKDLTAFAQKRTRKASWGKTLQTSKQELRKDRMWGNGLLEGFIRPEEGVHSFMRKKILFKREKYA